MRIINSDKKVHKNFLMREFLSKDPSLQEGHDLSDTTMKGIFFLRDHYGSEMKIDSTSRSKVYNLAIGGKTGSYHMKNQAIDFKFLDPDVQKQYKEDILSGGYVFNRLRSIGISGFGVYDSFGHIDDRKENCRSEDQYGKFQIWKGEEVLLWIRKQSVPLAVGLLAIGLLWKLV